MLGYELHPPHLINVATLPCENVILQRRIAKENCIKCNIASSKCTRVIMCLKFTYLWRYIACRPRQESFDMSTCIAV